MQEHLEEQLANILRARGWECIPPGASTNDRTPTEEEIASRQEAAITFLMYHPEQERGYPHVNRPDVLTQLLGLKNARAANVLLHQFLLLKNKSDGGVSHTRHAWEMLVQCSWDNLSRASNAGPKTREAVSAFLGAHGIAFGMRPDDPLILEARRRLAERA